MGVGDSVGALGVAFVVGSTAKYGCCYDRHEVGPELADALIAAIGGVKAVVKVMKTFQSVILFFTWHADCY
jgi:hypothetical protein